MLILEFAGDSFVFYTFKSEVIGHHYLSQVFICASFTGSQNVIHREPKWASSAQSTFHPTPATPSRRRRLSAVETRRRFSHRR